METPSAGSADYPVRPVRRRAAVLFGEELRARRRAAWWTQARLAEAAGVHEKYVSMVETGVRQPALETVLRLCRALEVRPGEVVGAVDARWEEEP